MARARRRDRRDEVLLAERLDEVAEDAGLDRARDELLLAVGGQHHDRDRPLVEDRFAASIPSRCGIFTSMIARSGSCSRASATASSPSRASATTSWPRALEQVAQVEADDRLVLGDQDAHRHIDSHDAADRRRSRRRAADPARSASAASRPTARWSSRSRRRGRAARRRRRWSSATASAMFLDRVAGRGARRPGDRRATRTTTTSTSRSKTSPTRVRSRRDRRVRPTTHDVTTGAGEVAQADAAELERRGDHALPERVQVRDDAQLDAGGGVASRAGRRARRTSSGSTALARDPVARRAVVALERLGGSR